MIIENAIKFNRFTILGVKTRMEGGVKICSFPVAREDADFFALECSRIQEQSSILDEYIELENDKSPEEWAEAIKKSNAHIREIGLEVLL